LLIYITAHREPDSWRPAQPKAVSATQLQSLGFSSAGDASVEKRPAPSTAQISLSFLVMNLEKALWQLFLSLFLLWHALGGIFSPHATAVDEDLTPGVACSTAGGSGELPEDRTRAGRSNKTANPK